jgi:hypothetical protein
VALLVGAGVYLGNLSSRAKQADQLDRDLKAAQTINHNLVVKAAKANKDRLAAEARKSELEVSLDEALKRRTTPVVVRRIIHAGSACLGPDALGMLNGAIADGNRAVRAAAD